MNKSEKFDVERLEVIIENGSLSIDLPPERGLTKKAYLNPKFNDYFPNVVFRNGMVIERNVVYHKNNDGNWEPYYSPGFKIFKPGGEEYKRIEKLVAEANIIYNELLNK